MYSYVLGGFGETKEEQKRTLATAVSSGADLGEKKKSVTKSKGLLSELASLLDFTV